MASQRIRDALVAGRCSAIEISHKIQTDSIGGRIVVLEDEREPTDPSRLVNHPETFRFAVGLSTNAVLDNCLEARIRSGRVGPLEARSSFDVETRFFAR